MFPARAGNVVVEGLNSLYQEDIDRYIQGDDVPKEHLQRAWRDTTQVFANPVMLTASEQFLSEIRSINLHLPPRLRIHVIAADPPINWAMIQSREQFLPFLLKRVDFAAEVIEREILQKQKKALLVFGLGHLMRNQQIKTTEGFIPLSPTLVELLDSNSPGRLWVVVPCRSSTGPNSATLTARIHNAKSNGLAIAIPNAHSSRGQRDKVDLMRSRPTTLDGTIRGGANLLSAVVGQDAAIRHLENDVVAD